MQGWEKVIIDISLMVKSLWFNLVERVIGVHFNNITVLQPEHLQACHEEAYTLIVLNVAIISAKTSL